MGSLIPRLIKLRKTQCHRTTRYYAQIGRWCSCQLFVAAPTRPEIAPGRPIFQAASIQRILRPPQHQFYPINWANSMVHPFWLKLDELT